MEIEDIILSRDKRTVSNLRRYLSPRFCEETAQFILDRPGPIMIATGFYMATTGAAETDGPPGAIALGRAMQALGQPVWYVTDRYATHLLQSEEERGAKVVEFPIVGKEESRKEAQRLLDEVKPAILVAIERAGLTMSSRYRNAAGGDITPYTARLDYLFLNHPATVGIGDGGNEIGMGVLFEAILRIPTLTPFPTVTPVTHLIVASVSNWGAYGLVAALSRMTGKDLLPDEKEHGAIIQWESDIGTTVAMLPQGVAGVDGFTVEENIETIRMLRQVIGVTRN